MNVANQEIRLRQLTSIDSIAAIEPSAYLMNLKKPSETSEIEQNTVILAILKR